MVRGAEQRSVVDVGSTAARPFLHVMRVTSTWRGCTQRPHASTIAHSECVALRCGEIPFAPALSEHLTIVAEQYAPHPGVADQFAHALGGDGLIHPVEPPDSGAVFEVVQADHRRYRGDTALTRRADPRCDQPEQYVQLFKENAGQRHNLWRIDARPSLWRRGRCCVLLRGFVTA